MCYSCDLFSFMLVTIFIITYSPYCQGAEEEYLIKTNKDIGNNKFLSHGKTLTMECKVTSPTSIINWKKNGLDIKVSERVRISPSNEVLEILDAIESDAGNYTCTVRFQKLKYDLTEDYVVIAGPSVNLDKMTSVMVGEKLVLNCMVSGVPIPTVSWVVGNETLTTSTDRITLLEERGVQNAILTINEITVEDQGSYKCKASNLANSTTAETMVIVKKAQNETNSVTNTAVIISVFISLLIIAIFVIITVKYRNKIPFLRKLL